MNKTIQICDKIKLPLDAVTQTFAFIARKGAGKTYAAGVLVEGLYAAADANGRDGVIGLETFNTSNARDAGLGTRQAIFNRKNRSSNGRKIR